MSDALGDIGSDFVVDKLKGARKGFYLGLVSAQDAFLDLLQERQLESLDLIASGFVPVVKSRGWDAELLGDPGDGEPLGTELDESVHLFGGVHRLVM
jgi:hypothetical protein